MATPYIGSKISLVSNAEIRYEGILYTINSQESTIALQSVRCKGTEGRKLPEIPPSNEIYDFIIFRGQDIKDLIVLESSNPAINDPAIVSVERRPQGADSGPSGTAKGYDSSKGHDRAKGFESGKGYDAAKGHQNGKGYDSGKGYDTSNRYDSGTGYSAGKGYDGKNGFAAKAHDSGKSYGSPKGTDGGKNHTYDSSKQYETGKNNSSKGQDYGKGSKTGKGDTQAVKGYYTGNSTGKAGKSGKGNDGKTKGNSGPTKNNTEVQNKGLSKGESKGSNRKGDETSSKGNTRAIGEYREGGRKGSGRRINGGNGIVGELLPEADANTKMQCAEDFDYTSANQKFDKVANAENLKPLDGYNKVKSFFDNISCQATERTGEAGRHRADREKVQKADLEAFGATELHRNGDERRGKGTRKGRP
jgi:hypothetical protein